MYDWPDVIDRGISAVSMVDQVYARSTNPDAIRKHRYACLKYPLHVIHIDETPTHIV